MKSRIIQLTVLSFLLTFFVGAAEAQIELGKDKVKVTFSIEQNKCEATIIAKVVVAKSWHINSTVLPEGSFGYPSSFKVDKTAMFKTVGGVIEPKPHVYLDEAADEMQSTHEGTFYMKRKITIESEKDFTITGAFDFQTCNESRCLPNDEYEFSLKVKGCSKEEEKIDENIEATFTEVNGDEAKNKDGEEFVKVKGAWHQVPEGNSKSFYKKYLTLVSE